MLNDKNYTLPIRNLELKPLKFKEKELQLKFEDKMKHFNMLNYSSENQVLKRFLIEGQEEATQKELLALVLSGTEIQTEVYQRKHALV